MALVLAVQPGRAGGVCCSRGWVATLGPSATSHHAQHYTTGNTIKTRLDSRILTIELLILYQESLIFSLLFYRVYAHRSIYSKFMSDI